jgi:tRNA-guanine family transglycosylase
MMAGADLFETEFPLALAQNGKILQLKTQGYDPAVDYVTNLKAVYSTFDTGSDLSLFVALVSDKLDESQLFVDLSVFQRGYRWGEGPLLDGCGCYACMNYSRSYIYHLYEVQEMNATILSAL